MGSTMEVLAQNAAAPAPEPAIGIQLMPLFNRMKMKEWLTYLASDSLQAVRFLPKAMDLRRSMLPIICGNGRKNPSLPMERISSRKVEGYA